MCLGLVQSQLFPIWVGLSVDLTFLQSPSFPSFNKNLYSSIPCSYIEITFTPMTVMLKQWKTNISRADKTSLKSFIPSLLLPPLEMYFSSRRSVYFFFFLFGFFAVNLFMRPFFLTLTASNGKAHLRRVVLFVVRSRWIFHVLSQHTSAHRKLSRAHGVASRQRLSVERRYI